ncbi:MAG: hypothetical protein WAZ48_12695 [Lysobacteraceae bacterium]
MKDWSDELSAALASGDPEYMKAMMARVPPDILQQATTWVERLARASLKDDRLQESLSHFDQLIALSPLNFDARLERTRICLRLDRLSEALAEAGRLVELAATRAEGYLLGGEAQERLGESELALAAYRQALEREPEDAGLKQRVQHLETRLRMDSILKQTLHPGAAEEPVHDPMPRPEARFDPALLEDPSLSEATGPFRVDGLRQHLSRYGNQQSPRQCIARLEDPAWIKAWDSALSALSGDRVLFCGSELGVFGLRALHHGAAQALCAESYALDARITAGVIQKHFLLPWQERHGAALKDRTAEERRASFEAFVQGIDIEGPEGTQRDEGGHDVLVFPRIDHSLLGTGIVKAIRRYQTSATGKPTRVLPARATLFAMAIQWQYPSADSPLPELDRLRWSLYPQALELDDTFWSALTAPMQVAEIDFVDFKEQRLEVQLPVDRAGQVDAIVYWFDLDLGAARLGNAPGSGLRCIKPAVQYTDPIDVRPMQSLPVSIRIDETRLYLQAQPAPRQLHAQNVPAWFIPTLGDQRRYEAYEEAINVSQSLHPARTALNIGAGCGLLATLAARTGVERVVGTETQAAICAVGQHAIQRSGLEKRITLLNKDCRNVVIPEDFSERADLALFDAFDCSLIGEGILHFLAHAREHLLDEHARFVPAGASIRAMLIEYRLDRILDIDVNLLNPYRFTPSFINVDASTLPYRALSTPFDVFDFDFSSDGPAPAEKQLTIHAVAPGTAGAVLFWFDLRMDQSASLSNAPQSSDALKWKQGLQFLPELHVTPEMDLPVLARHDGSQLRFQWQADALPAEAFSRLPRFDPRWLAASQELEQQTRDLLQHCAQNPDEFAKVSDLAMRFAIDPAAHGLDPVIAQRFAAMMLGS